jgi:hypothetical protein
MNSRQAGCLLFGCVCYLDECYLKTDHTKNTTLLPLAKVVRSQFSFILLSRMLLVTSLIFLKIELLQALRTVNFLTVLVFLLMQSITPESIHSKMLV